ncbi:MAG TPA: hypothetical protein VG711_01775 [Phycisphaerales bacterium]|nr:hypothetical protein [Phycisphaerales bacterium]
MTASLSSRICVLILAVFLVSLFLLSAKADPPRSTQLDTLKDKSGTASVNSADGALLDPASDPYAVLTRVLHESGWPIDLSAFYAARMLHLIDADEPEPKWTPTDKERENVFLSPDSDPYAVLTRAYMEGGWGYEDAVHHAANSLGLINENVAGGGTQCYAALSTFYYCEQAHGEWEKRRVEHWLNGVCFDGPSGNDGIGHCLAIAPACLNGDIKWVKLHAQGSANGNCLGLPVGTCVSAGIHDPSYIPCPSEGLTSCSCFLELASGPVNCGSLDIQCCPEKTGCSFNCPMSCN